MKLYLLCEFNLLPNFVYVYFLAELDMNLVISSYWCATMVPWCVCRNNVHGSSQILSKKYCHVKEQEDENCHFKGITASCFDLPFPLHVEWGWQLLKYSNCLSLITVAVQYKYCTITTLGSVTHHDWPWIEHLKHFLMCHNQPWTPTSLKQWTYV